MEQEYNFIKALEDLSYRDLKPDWHDIDDMNKKYNNKIIKKEDLKEYCTILSSRLDYVTEMFVTMTPSDKKLMARKIVTFAGRKENRACNIYCEIAKALKKDDMSTAFSTYTALANSYKRIIDSINRSLDKWFADEKITYENTRLTQVALYGMFKEINLFCNYTTSLFTYTVYEITQHNNINELHEPSKYLKLQIEDKKDEFVQNCNHRLYENPFVYSEDMDKVRKFVDINIFNVKGNPNTAFLDPSQVPNSIRHSVRLGAQGFIHIMFRWIGEQWMMHKHLKYLKQKKEKEWIEAHIALMKMDLMNADPNSDEYRKTVAVIDAYSEQLAELEQKIAEYEGEDI